MAPMVWPRWCGRGRGGGAAPVVGVAYGVRPRCRGRRRRGGAVDVLTRRTLSTLDGAWCVSLPPPPPPSLPSASSSVGMTDVVEQQILRQAARARTGPTGPFY